MIVGVFSYPVGGAIWSASQVTGVAMVRGESLLELQNPNWVKSVAKEVIGAARIDRFRRFIPGIPQERCYPIEFALKTAEGWVRVEIHCPSGFMLDYIPREAWR